MPVESALCIVVPIFKGKDNIRNCSCYGAVKLPEHGMKVVQNVLGKGLHRIVSVDEMKIGFMLREEQLMLCLSCEGYKNSVMLKKKVVCVLWT